MNQDEFVGQVQHAARLGSRGDAERAIRATLETLAERITPDAARNLAAQLPFETARHLGAEPQYAKRPDWPWNEHARSATAADFGLSNSTGLADAAAEAAQRFGVDEFVDRVSQREGVDRGRAAYDARAVFETLRQAVTPGQMDKLLAQLPDELDRLATAGTEGNLDL